MNKGFKKTVVWLSIGISVLLLGILVVLGCNYYLEYIQIQEIGENFTSVFIKNTLTQLFVQSVSFIVVFTVIFFSLMKVRKNMLKEDKETFRFLEPVFPIGLISFLFAIISTNLINKAVYSNFLMFLNTTEWGRTDPVFGQDLSYYIFVRPFLISLLDSLIGLAIFVTCLVAILYILFYGKLGFNNIKNILKNKRITTHMVFNVLIIVVIRLFAYRFKAEDILFAEFADGVRGAGFTNVYIWLKYYKAVPYVGALIVAGVLLFFNKGKYKYSICTALIFPVILIATTASALIIQHFQVNPAEAQMEAPYIGFHINATRAAYGLSDLQEQEFMINNDWSAQDFQNHTEDIKEISLLDPTVSKKVIEQLQGIRKYYEFLDIDTVAYKINGEKEAIMISPRELKKLEESPTSQSYSNDKMHFTHGYGIVAFPANQITADGRPVLYVKDTPIVSTVSEIQITEPRIYYGEYRDDYSIVNTTIKEFDHLENGQKVENEYQGQSGIPMTFMNRLLFAIRYGDYQLLTANQITSESKLLINTNVLDRMKVAAPFLTFDENPYLLVNSEGRLKWIVDAYTTSDQYPYSKMHEKGFNYICNSAKAVVDAYDGTVQIYITNPDDKLITVYQKIYPEVFTDEDFPEDLRYSLRYPETYFNIQTEILKQYHIEDGVTFYNRSDNWDVAREIRSETSSWKESISQSQKKTVMEPVYQMITTDGERNLRLMIPFTVEGKDNMVAWLSAGSDGDCYGQLTLYQIPQEKTVYGPLQIEKLINSTPEIEKAMSVWGSGESTIIRGNIITAPIGDSILYAEPIYVTAGKNTFPELKMVVAAYDSKIAVKPTLTQAVNALLPPESFVPDLPIFINPEEPTNPENTDLINLQRITEAFNRVQEASKNNDWEEFGNAMKDLEAIIDELNEAAMEQSDTTDLSESDGSSET
ncbi:MAG: UPF0182 family protein [Clostridia bacterium]|nr:UPF0182 family protein [Clostridia bacterium]